MAKGKSLPPAFMKKAKGAAKGPGEPDADDQKRTFPKGGAKMAPPKKK